MQIQIKGKVKSIVMLESSFLVSIKLGLHYILDYPKKRGNPKVVGIMWRSGLGRRTHFDTFVSQHLSGAGSSPAGSVGRDFNLQKLNFQYLTISVAVVLVVRWYFND